ncbi:MAG: P1 family peptidase [Anaerolineales bacterium]|nr:P1 family peptidase [Anaerolineales bacterium]
MARSRIRDLGIHIGVLPTGAFNAITDVPGVKVGHSTLISGEGLLKPGLGPVRTGVTAILPHGQNLFREKVCAAVYTINGYGKACGFEQVRELGLLESPIALTNTLNVGLVLDALVQEAVHHNPDIGISTSSVNIVVGETNDGFLNDIQGRHVRAEHVWATLHEASDGPVPEGAVGAGTGTMCFGWKGGIGVSSRVLPDEAGGFTLGVLVQTNFGNPQDLIVAGFPLGRRLRPAEHRPEILGGGSVMVVMATDAPLRSDQLRRLCVRAGAGLARTGSYYGHGSGDFVIAFSTAYRIDHDSGNPAGGLDNQIESPKVLNGLFQAVVEAVEEAVLNSLCCAETMIGRDNHLAEALPLDQMMEMLK